MNILFFTEISIFPVDGGEKIRSYGLLKALSDLGHNIVAVIGNDSDVDLNICEITNVKFKFIKKNKRSLYHYFGLLYFMCDLEIENTLSCILDKENIDICFIDFGFLGHYIHICKRYNKPVILGTHNAQAYLTLQKPARNMFLFLRKYQIYVLQKIHERFFFNKADALITVSEEDKVYHSCIVAEEKIYVVPNFLDEERYRVTYEKEDYYVMTANFGVYMNKEGIRWFIKYVWDSDIDSKCKLLLVGKKSKEVLNGNKYAKKYNNIIAVGAVDDIRPYIGKSKAVIIPLLHGSGSRLKCIEAMALKTCIISTEKGVEGIQSSNIDIAYTVDEYKSLLKNNTINYERGNALHKEFLRMYTVGSNKEKISNIIRIGLTKAK